MDFTIFFIVLIQKMLFEWVVLKKSVFPVYDAHCNGMTKVFS